MFTLASAAAAEVDPMIAGVVAAALTTEAIRDAIRRATTVVGYGSVGSGRASR